MRRIIVSDLWAWIITANRWIVIISSLVLVSLICLQIILRYIFRSPLLGLEEIAIMVVPWLWFFGIAFASLKGFHISGGFPVERQSIQNILRVVYPFVCVIVTLVFCYLTYQYCYWVAKEGVKSIALVIPWIYTVLGVFLGLMFNAVYLISEAVAKLRAFRQARERGS